MSETDDCSFTKGLKTSESAESNRKSAPACSRWFIAAHQSRTQHFSSYLFLDFWPTNFRRSGTRQQWTNKSNSPFPRQPTDACSFLLFLLSSSSPWWKKALTCTPTRVIMLDKTSLLIHPYLSFPPLLHIYLYQHRKGEVALPHRPVYVSFMTR